MKAGLERQVGRACQVRLFVFLHLISSRLTLHLVFHPWNSGRLFFLFAFSSFLQLAIATRSLTHPTWNQPTNHSTSTESCQETVPKKEKTLLLKYEDPNTSSSPFNSSDYCLHTVSFGGSQHPIIWLTSASLSSLFRHPRVAVGRISAWATTTTTVYRGLDRRERGKE